MLSCPFKDESERNIAYARFRNCALTYGKNSIWSAPSLPLDRRIPQSFLFAFKRLLLSWEFNKAAVRVNTDETSLKVEGKFVCKAEAHDHKLRISWNPEWESWNDLHNDEAFKNLIQSCSSKLARGGAASKGKGKKGKN